MKKTVAIILCLIILLLSSACSAEPQVPQTLPPQQEPYDATGYQVQGVMAYPDYTFSSTPTTDELRATAVKAFKDVLSVRWSIPKTVIYNKTGPVSEKTFRHNADTTYAGVIYSNANTGLFQFLEYYDFDTGRIYYPGKSDEFKETLGASCADAMLWGLNAVCNSVTGPYYPVYMVYKNGYLPVGDYTYDFTINSFHQQPSYKIIQLNGEAVMLDAYTKVLPGDMFVSYQDNHGMMAISKPVVKYLPDGSIDAANSHILIQDQRGGEGAGFYKVKEDGQMLLYSGRTSALFSFQELLKHSYLPVTVAEFTGAKEYEPCTASISSPCTSLTQLQEATVSSNYPLAVVNVIAADAFGNETVIGRQLFNGAHINGVPRSFALKDIPIIADFENSSYNRRSYTVKIEVVPSTGQRFIVTELAL